jgi:hypothetical protein
MCSSTNAWTLAGSICASASRSGSSPALEHGLGDADAVAVLHQIEVLAGDRGRHRAAADAAGAEARLLAGESDHLDRPARPVPAGAQLPDRLDRA